MLLDISKKKQALKPNFIVETDLHQIRPRYELDISSAFFIFLLAAMLLQSHILFYMTLFFYGFIDILS